MTSTPRRSRIIFLDVIRAFALVMMLQGHTIDTFLGVDYRSRSYFLYTVWEYMRGMTAPIFLFTAGTVFMYLFRINGEPFASNPRVVKGVKRAGLLVLVGYLLRFPTSNPFDYRWVSEGGWRIFFSVDILHLIGFGLLFLMAWAWLAEKLKAKDQVVLGVMAGLVIVLHFFFEQIDWVEFLHPAVAGYFYRGSGSLFPLFPWLCYIYFGGILGSYLAHNPAAFKKLNFVGTLAATGAVLMLVSYLPEIFGMGVPDTAGNWLGRLKLIMLRMGFVLLANSFFALVAIEARSIPLFVIHLGRNTLLLYVIHLAILYGSAWNPGFYKWLGKSFTPVEAVLAAVTMIMMMSLLVYVMYLYQEDKIPFLRKKNSRS